MVEIDELFVLPISILNKKGYITEYCCSGHIFERYEYYPPNAYISFNGSVKITEIPLPSGYRLELDIWTRQNVVCIRKYFKTNSVSETQKEILQNALDILDWVENLPNKE